MRDPWLWDLGDVERLISERVPESLTLDYKNSAALDKSNANKVNELLKDISAFANSAGGTLVYGVNEQNRLPYGFDAGIDPKSVSTEWIQHIAYGAIQPRIEGLRMRPIEMDAPGRFVYVVHVPQSRTAHMSVEHKYFKRHDGQSIPMEDYEVRLAMRRSETPDVRLSLVNHPTDPVEMFLMIRNTSPTPAEYFALSLLLGPGVTLVRADGILTAGSVKYGGRAAKVIVDGVEDVYSEWRYEWWGRMPLFNSGWEQLSLMQLGYGPNCKILWLVEGPGMLNRGAYLVANDVVPHRFKSTDNAVWDFA